MRKEYRAQHEDLLTMILDGQNQYLLHNSMNYKHINTLVMQYFDSFTAGDVLHHLLSLLSDRSLRGDEERHRQCFLNRLEVLKRNLRSVLLHEFLRSSLSSSSSASLSSSVQFPAPIIRQLPIDELSQRSLRWLASLSPCTYVVYICCIYECMYTYHFINISHNFRVISSFINHLRHPYIHTPSSCFNIYILSMHIILSIHWFELYLCQYPIRVSTVRRAIERLLCLWACVSAATGILHWYVRGSSICPTLIKPSPSLLRLAGEATKMFPSMLAASCCGWAYRPPYRRDSLLLVTLT